LPKCGSDSTGLFRSACGGQVPTSFCVAHSHPAADPSDTALEPFANKRQNFLAWKEYWLAVWQGTSHKIAEKFST
jgi:hypothetical protein